MSVRSRLREQEAALKEEEWGFGNQNGNRGARMIRLDGGFNVVRSGDHWLAFNPYHWFVRLSWSRFWVFLLAFYIVINLLFTLVYVALGTHHLTGDEAQFRYCASFLHAFFFSIQTFTTVGYGGVVPIGFAANAVAGLEALAGLLSAALMSSMFFARFSKATVSIAHSENALISPYEDATGLMFRIANRRNNNMSDVSVLITMSYLEIDPKTGNERREFDRLELVTSSIKMFPLNWTLVHKIDETSLLFGKNAVDFQREDIELLITVSGYDDTYAQQVHTRFSYRWDEILCGQKFLPMYNTRKDGITVLDLSRISKYHKIVIS